MHKTLTFNGIRKPWLYLLEGRQKSPFAPVRNNLIRVNGMPGAYVASKETDVLYITQPIGFIVEDDKHALQLKDELAEWLVTNEAVPLQFDDEPGRTYYAEIEGTIEDFSRFVDQRKGVLTFLCADPFSYGEEETVNFQNDTVLIENKGTAEADPVFELEVLEPVTFAMVSNGTEYNMIGRPANIDDIPSQKYESVFSTNASSLVGWSTIPSGSTIDEGIVGGNMAVQGGYAFYAETFGTNPNGWVGPAVKRSLIRPVQDFRMTMDMALFNRQGNVGKIVVSLLDESDNVIASVQMVDATNSAWRNRAIIRVGTANQGQDLINHAPERGGWNDFRGVLRIERIGNEFKAYVARVTDGRHHGRLNSQPYVDRLGEYSAKVAQVRVYIAKARNYDPFPMYFHGGNVWEIHDLDSYEIPYIADEGDIITFDHKEDEMYINGEPRKDLKTEFGGTYFKLAKGINNIAVMTEGAFNTSCKYRNKYR